jgi:hypothetical protein
MKRLSLLGFGLLASILAGCPIFSGDGDGWTQGSSGTPGCSQPSDCAQNETCGADGQCHSGDCTFWTCPSGYTCELSPIGGDAGADTATCVPGGSSTGGSASTSTGMGGATSTGGSASTSTSAGGATSTGGSASTSTGAGGSTSASTGAGGSSSTPVYCGHPADCSTSQICASDGTCQAGPCSATNACIYGYTCQADGTCASSTPNACDSDSSCTSGSLCVAGSNGKGGVCTTPSNQCFDQSQCGVNEKCADGKCTLGCSSSTDCRDGYTCDTTSGVCSVVAKACTVTNDCGSATQVCVGGACVPRSTGGTCANPGDVWDENGCIPNQAGSFTCVNDGTQDACAMGSICLHHDCWISCDSPNQNACASQPALDTCKPVADGSSTYNVCGTSTNLGSQCGAGSNGNQSCTGGTVCIDGFCK